MRFAQHKVLELASQGLTDKQIAARLGVTESTVRTHKSNAGIKRATITRLVPALEDDEVPDSPLAGRLRSISNEQLLDYAERRYDKNRETLRPPSVIEEYLSSVDAWLRNPVDSNAATRLRALKNLIDSRPLYTWGSESANERPDST